MVIISTDAIFNDRKIL